MGREGPSVQIGAGLASAIGQWLRLPEKRTKSLVPVGASAALAAAFNTPVAAVLFALEEIIADLNATLLGSTVIASIAAVVVARSILGNEPLFHVPEYELVDPFELLAYVVLGVVCGLASLAFTKGLLRARAFFMGLPASTRMWQPAMGGLAIGVLLVFFPEVAGVGYENVDRALNGGQVIPEVAGFAYGHSDETIALLLAIGIFAPTLFLGALVGGIVGLAAQMLVPLLGVAQIGAPGAYALVGMGALFAGVIRAPMTSVFMIFELTQDYQIFVPLMVANMISFAISRRYQAEPVYHALLKQDQVHLPGFVRQSAGGWRAGDVMSDDFRFVEAHTTVETAFARLSDVPAPCLLVGSKDQLLGLVSTERLVEEMSAGRGQQPVASVMSEDWAHVHADHAIDVVMERFGSNPGVLPVLSRADINSVKGVITRDTLMRVFGRKAAASSEE
jgi:CIC family chloride channel protein